MYLLAKPESGLALYDEIRPPQGRTYLGLKTWYREKLKFIPVNFRARPSIWKMKEIEEMIPCKTACAPNPVPGSKAVSKNYTASQLEIQAVYDSWSNTPTSLSSITGTYDNTLTVYDDVVVNQEAKTCTTECKQKENTMARVYTNNLDGAQKNYLFDRLASAEKTKLNELRETFHLDDDKAPTTPKEFIERIQAGKIVLPKDADEPGRYSYYSVRDFAEIINWRDPAVVKDQAGFDVAKAKLTTARREAEDVIMLQDAAAGLKAFQGFQSATFH